MASVSVAGVLLLVGLVVQWALTGHVAPLLVIAGGGLIALGQTRDAWPLPRTKAQVLDACPDLREAYPIRRLADEPYRG